MDYKSSEQENYLIGGPKTIGELKELIKDYPDEIPFGFRNQPFQVLWHFIDKGNSFICFQEEMNPVIQDAIERKNTDEINPLFDPETIKMQLAILRNIQNLLFLSDKERSIPNWVLVNRILLFHTKKCGHTCSIEHCKFLEIDPDSHTFY